MHRAYKQSALLVAFFALLSLAACSRQSGVPVVPERVAGATFFVERHEKDTRDIAAHVAAGIERRGYRVSSGSRLLAPDAYDFLVTYEDRWYWDMRMYLQQLRITIRDREGGAAIAHGESFQDSVASLGKSYDDIVDRALDQIFPSER